MTVRELIAELSKYPPEAEVEIETPLSIEAIQRVRQEASDLIHIHCDEDDNDEDDDLYDHEPFHIESSDSFDPRSDDTDD